MSGQRKTGRSKSGQDKAADDRLGDALRANLRRRKAQAKAREANTAGTTEEQKPGANDPDERGSDG